MKEGGGGVGVGGGRWKADLKDLMVNKGGGGGTTKGKMNI